MIIRVLTQKDAPQLFALIQTIEAALPDEQFWLPIKNEARAHFFDPTWTEFYGAFDGETLVGAAALFYSAYEYGESLQQLSVPHTAVAEIGRAMVHPDYRGNRLLNKICLHLLERAGEKGIRLLLATVHPENTPSQKAFSRLGMVKSCSYTKENGYVRDILTMTLPQ